jgi:hypothetical protein
MTTHDDLRLSLGSYLTASLGPAARAEVEEHLHHCEACRSEVVELAGLPGLLGRLGREELGRWPSAPDEPEPGVVRPPDGLLSGLLAQAERIEATSRRRLRRLRAASVTAAVAAVAAVAFAVAPTLATSPGTSYRLRPETVASHLAGQVTLVPKPWGTELSLALQGLPEGADCVAVVTGVDGRRSTIGSWSATPDHAAKVEVASDLAPTQLGSFAVETTAGVVLLTGVLHVADRPT